MAFPNQLALISPADLQKLVEDSMRKVWDEKGSSGPVGALRLEQAASYIGVSRRSFYYLLHKDPDLDQACFRVGTTRLWPVAELDAWMERQVAKGQPKKKEAA
jgi:predicted DNA-binding transcriptional regulator AlpA